MQTMTGPRLRERFPTLETSTYLVSHSMGAPPIGAKAALAEFWDAWAANGPEAWNAWLPQMAEIADNLGRIFHAPKGTVSLLPNVSLAMAVIGSSLVFEPDRDEVIVESLQFPSVVYVWQAWAKYGARLTVVPSDDGRTMSTDKLCAAITERTKLVVLSHAAYVSGSVIDVAAISARCRETGALFVLDAYQTTGIYPFDVTELGVDVVVGGSHKWLCGGPGCGFIYVRPDLRATFEPAVTGWMGHETPFAFSPAPMLFAQGQHRFTTGTPTIPGYVVARAGHDAILDVGVENIRAHNVRLTTILAEGALARGLTIPTPLDPKQRTGWIGIAFEGSQEVTRELVKRRIFLDWRPDCGIRVSPHFYTTEDEIAAFFEAIDDIRKA
jgi:kynureninase